MPELACRYPAPTHPGLVPVPDGRILGQKAEQDESRGHWFGHWGGPAHSPWIRHSASYAVAAKTHRCLLCDQPILRGELHYRYRAPWWEMVEGDPGMGFATLRQCEWCSTQRVEWDGDEPLLQVQERWLELLVEEGLLPRWQSFCATIEDLRRTMRADEEQWLRELEACRG